MMDPVLVAVNTTRIDSWGGQITEIGPMYPFVGWEWLMLVICVVIVLYWFVAEHRMENKMYEEEIEEFGDEASMTSIVKGDLYSLSRTDIPKQDTPKE
jgi:hypothetical protein